MTGNLKERYREPFYRRYLIYTALETELLFYMLYDAVFLTQAKNLSLKEISLITFVSLALSLLIQYPLLRWINRAGNKKAVRLGSLLFLFASLLFLFGDHFFWILFAGFLKCVGHACNSLGPALLKNRLKKDHREEMYVSYQSDANTMTSAAVMITAFLLGILSQKSLYLPMIACCICSLLGVLVSFVLSEEETGDHEIISRKEAGEYAREKKRIPGIRLLILSFAFFTALTGTGLTYVRADILMVLENAGSMAVIRLLTHASVLIYLLRILSNVFLAGIYSRIRNLAMIAVSFLLCLGISLLYLPWILSLSESALVTVLFGGYLLLAFVRDPYVTITQQVSLVNRDLREQQTVLIALNSAKKIGSMALSAIASLLLGTYAIDSVIILMLGMAFISFLLSILVIYRTPKENLQDLLGLSAPRE